MSAQGRGTDVRTSPPAGLVIRDYRDGDDEGILDLYLETFGRWPKHELTVPPLDHLRWKLASDGGRAETRPLLAEVEGRIVGAMSVIVQPVKVNDRVLVSGQGLDSVVLPEYQNTGVMRELSRVANQVERRLALEMSFGIQSSHPALAHKRDSYTGDRCDLAADVLVADTTEALPEASDLPAGVTVRDVPAFDARVDELWDEASKPFQFAVERRRDYLNWRYCDDRAGRFTVAIAEEGDRVLAYVVQRISHGKGNIADVLVLPGRDDALAALAGQALRNLQAQGTRSVRCWSPAAHPYRDVLRQAGFVDKKRTVYLSCSTVAAPFEVLAFLNEPGAAIHITAGDTDLV